MRLLVTGANGQVEATFASLPDPKPANASLELMEARRKWAATRDAVEVAREQSSSFELLTKDSDAPRPTHSN